jgi:RNA-binding protein
MASLTSKQRAHLRSLAQRLKALLHVGKDGVTDTLVRSTLDAFNTRELLKVKVLESSPDDARETAQQLLKRLEDVELVQVIGRTIVLYRKHPEKPDP